MRKDIYTAKTVSAGTIERIPTGIQSVDRVITGGIPRGGMTILSGKSSSGKSTIASQIVSEAQDYGHTILWYAGETPEGVVKEKLVRQTIGGRYIFSDPNPATGEPYYYAYSDIEKYVGEHYKNKVFFYRPEPEGICKISILEQFRRELEETGADVFVVDNLMTVVAAMTGGGDEYAKQAQAAVYLSELAAELGIWVILLAHISVKLREGNATGQEAIKGATEISQASTLIITIAGDPTSKLVLDKLRDEVGATVPRGTEIPVYYDMKSMRTYAFTGEDERTCKAAFEHDGISMEWEEQYWEQYLPMVMDNAPAPPEYITKAKIMRAKRRTAAKMVLARKERNFLDTLGGGKDV